MPEGEVPVVVELFSSEGCSSCPPADALFRELEADASEDDVVLLPLELHVDYWNDLGWADPYSDAAYSERQRDYARTARRRGVFTPEAIVDGRDSVSGADRAAIRGAARRAAVATEVRLTLKRAGARLVLTQAGQTDEPSSLVVAWTESALETRVTAGENRGSTLRHGPVVRALTRIGAAKAGATEIELPSLSSNGGRFGAVAFVQHVDDRAIVGATRLELGSSIEP